MDPIESVEDPICKIQSKIVSFIDLSITNLASPNINIELVRFEMTNQYNYGRKKEHLVANRLRNKGASVKLSPGSRGAADLVARFDTKTWLVQVKSTRSGTPASPTAANLGNLKRSATNSSATPVVAEVSGKKVKYFSARDGRELKP